MDPSLLQVLAILLMLLLWIPSYLIGIRKMLDIIPTVRSDRIDEPDKVSGIIGRWLFLLGIYAVFIPWGLKQLPQKIAIYVIIFLPLVILMRIYAAILTHEKQA